MSDDIFPQQQKVRHAELISPPNRLKEKVGSGGIDENVLQKAQELLERNTINFDPIANMLLDLLVEAIADAKSGALKGEDALGAMIYPAMQLKAQGTMFHYPLVSDISHILVNFLETVEDLNRDVLDIVVAHKMAIKAVLASQLKGDGGKTGKELREALMEACGRYYRSKKPQ
ncbi:MAG: hypothetical protein RBS08_04650 [Bdellovibrionales bacterium]|jgi:hypothetical protein|nr:hypothetical protein [Bdellovibrionales bacterium]